MELYYPPEARETQRLELCNLKCGTDEDIDQYVYRLEQKFDRAHPELISRDFVDIRADMLKLCFLTGLPEHYQKKLREIPGLTYEHAQLQARQFKVADQYEATRYPTAIAQPVRSSTTITDKEEIASLKSQLAALTLGTSVGYAGREPLIKQEPEWRTNAARPYAQPYRSQDNRYLDNNSEQRERWNTRERITTRFNVTNAAV